MKIIYLVTLIASVIWNADGLETKPENESALFPGASGPGDFPCPDAEDILPCICQSYMPNQMDIDCSSVSNEDELKRVFSESFPSNNFKDLTIKKNHHLNQLDFGVFGNATFVDVFIENNAIARVEDNVFQKSAETMESLYLIHNQITSFPFDELRTYSSLRHLFLSYNGLNSKTMDGVRIVSEYIEGLFLDGNNFTRINNEDIDIPNAHEMSMRDCQILEIETDAFTKMANLTYLALSGNRISNLHERVIELHGNDSMLFLSNNNLASVSKEAIKGVTGSIYLENNLLRELPEDTWRPIFETAKNVHLADNPLLCGCDIAWLIINRDFIRKLAGTETCDNKIKLIDLDPDVYRELCN